MNELTGYKRAKLVAHWIDKKPTNSKGEVIPLEKYIEKVCEQKGWKYKQITKGKK